MLAKLINAKLRQFKVQSGDRQKVFIRALKLKNVSYYNRKV